MTNVVENVIFYSTKRNGFSKPITFNKQSQFPSPEWNDILFGCGWSEAEAVPKRYSGKREKAPNKKNPRPRPRITFL